MDSGCRDWLKCCGLFANFAFWVVRCTRGRPAEQEIGTERVDDPRYADEARWGERFGPEAGPCSSYSSARRRLFVACNRRRRSSLRSPAFSPSAATLFTSIAASFIPDRMRLPLAVIE